MNSVVTATVRNLRVAELVNIYEVFLLSWPLAERMERYLLLNHLRSVTPRWSYLSDLTQISNPKFSRDVGGGVCGNLTVY